MKRSPSPSPSRRTPAKAAPAARGVVPAKVSPAAKPPRRAEAPTAPVPGAEAEVNRYVAAYIMGVANRLASGASNYYRRRYGMGMPEWRTMMAIGSGSGRIVREVAEMADLDYAAASKSLKSLQERGYVVVEQTNRRGRAAIPSLTPEGQVIYRQLRQSAKKRQDRLLAAFAPAEIEQLWALLRRVEQQIPHMNAVA